MKIEIKNQDQVKALLNGENELILFYNNEYVEGDHICIYPDQVPVYLNVQVDDAIISSMIYIKEGIFEYFIPCGNERKSYSYKAFYNKKHLIRVSKASYQQINAYQNLALNTSDQVYLLNVYPHATSSEDCSLSPVFQPKNVIDGLTFNTEHGRWPFTSWSYQQNPQATLTIHFGRKVNVQDIHIYLRADFPHDSYFQNISLEYSNHHCSHFSLQKVSHVQTFSVDEEDVEWIRFYQFKKADEKAVFAAITQIEVYGYNQ